jgi:hypothetical protein
MRTLASAMDRILPGARGLSAADTAVMRCMDWLLSRRHRSAQAARLAAGLELLDSVSRAMWQRPFVDCDSDQQDRALRLVQETPHPSVQRFFAALVEFTLEIFMSAPSHGGNRYRTGWAYINFDPHPLTAGAGRTHLGGYAR